MVTLPPPQTRPRVKFLSSVAIWSNRSAPCCVKKTTLFGTTRVKARTLFVIGFAAGKPLPAPSWKVGDQATRSMQLRLQKREQIRCVSLICVNAR